MLYRAYDARNRGWGNWCFASLVNQSRLVELQHLYCARDGCERPALAEEGVTNVRAVF